MKFEDSGLSRIRYSFCEQYIVDQIGTKAAVRAGYSKATAAQQASKLIRLVKVKECIQSLLDERSDRARINADYVLFTIKETVEACKQLAPVIKTDKAGKEREYLVPIDVQGVYRGTEQLGRSLKLFTDKVEVTDTTLDTMSEEELDRELSKARQTNDIVTREVQDSVKH